MKVMIWSYKLFGAQWWFRIFNSIEPVYRNSGKIWARKFSRNTFLNLIHGISRTEYWDGYSHTTIWRRNFPLLFWYISNFGLGRSPWCLFQHSYFAIIIAIKREGCLYFVMDLIAVLVWYTSPLLNIFSPPYLDFTPFNSSYCSVSSIYLVFQFITNLIFILTPEDVNSQKSILNIQIQDMWSWLHREWTDKWRYITK